MVNPVMILKDNPEVECLIRPGSDYAFPQAMFAGLSRLIAENFCNSSLRCDLKGSTGLEVTQPIFEILPDHRVPRLEINGTTDPTDFIDRLNYFPHSLLPLGFVIDGTALADLKIKDSYKGIQAVNPMNLNEGHFAPFEHRDRFEKALLKLCGSSTRLRLGLYVPNSTQDEIMARRLKVQLSSKFPVVVPSYAELHNSSSEDFAQIVAQTLMSNQKDLFGLGRGIF